MLNFEKGFIDKEQILSYVTEEEIFELVFGFQPQEYDYIKSPFRIDSSPGCYFEYSYRGNLMFKDFADPRIINGVKVGLMDCFDAVKLKFNIPNFYQTLEFIKGALITGKNKGLNKKDKKEVPVITTKIFIDRRGFENKDKRFWKDKYGISKEDLISDNIFPVRKYSIQSRKGNYIKRVQGIGYSLGIFGGNRRKLYFPYNVHKNRFISTTGADDIGRAGVDRDSNLLIITKSYKDARVLYNEGYNVRWFQNEGMIPNDDLLFPLCNKFKDIVVFYDSDETGILAGIKVQQSIKRHKDKKVTTLHLPLRLYKDRGIKDPSDMYHKMGQLNLHNFLRDKLPLDVYN